MAPPLATNLDEQTDGEVSRLYALDRYLCASVPSIVNLQKLESMTVKKSIEEAISRITAASLDHYNSIFAQSIRWPSDDTGSMDDSDLFMKTISKLQNTETTVITRERLLAEKGDTSSFIYSFMSDLNAELHSMDGKRKLFIFHYAGHATSSTRSGGNLFLTPRISHQEGEDDDDAGHTGTVTPRYNMSLIRDLLRDLASNTFGLDILILLDCCCAATAGRGKVARGERVELMAATSGGGISNSRLDGTTFTQHWCQAFDGLLERGGSFTCDDILSTINEECHLDQYPATFVLREGWGIPVTFRALLASTSALTSNPPRTVIAAIHLVENPQSTTMNALIDYLQDAPGYLKITVLAALPVSSTLLLLRVPLVLQQMLVLPQVTFIFVDDIN